MASLRVRLPDSTTWTVAPRSFMRNTFRLCRSTSSAPMKIAQRSPKSAATVAALFGLRCAIFMGAEDVERQSLNVFRMKLLGATVHVVESGSRTLKDAMTEALRDWIATVEDTFYLIGSTAGPHPYPLIVRDFQAVIGQE